MMDGLRRILVLIGSGELAPPMAKVHREVMRMLAGEGTGVRRRPALQAAIVDTPYGFQSNADALSAELVGFFGGRLGLHATLASLRRSDGDLVGRETALARIREADFVFSGPGSPSYAVRHWAGGPVPQLFADKLLGGGALVMASAAAATLGRLTMPVYEIYKSGEDPHWLPGLDVLAAIDLDACVIPHWNNGEGGDHDTRYCFLGERKLRLLEEQLPDDVFILGIDEHTALLIDVDRAQAVVHGRGGVTTRHRGVGTFYPAGTHVPLDDMRRSKVGDTVAAPGRPEEEPDDAVALAQRVVELDDQVAALTEKSLLADRLMEALIELRRAARADGDFATADAIRDRLHGLGIEVQDSAGGTSDYRRGSY